MQGNPPAQSIRPPRDNPQAPSIPPRAEIRKPSPWSIHGWKGNTAPRWPRTHSMKRPNHSGRSGAASSDLDAALKHYQRARTLQPGDADACLGISRTLTQMHRAAEAEPYLKRSVQLDAFTAAAHYRLSLVYRSTGRTEDAQRELAEFQRFKDMKGAP